jgi:ribonuclease P protein component
MEAVKRFRFPKSARISSKKDIDRLFDKGESFIAYPLRIVYRSDVEANPSESGISILISIPKRRIKRAVDRNRLKRLVRETFRLNQHRITPPEHTRLQIAFMYIANEITSYAHIEKAMWKAIGTLNSQTNKNQPL